MNEVEQTSIEERKEWETPEVTDHELADATRAGFLLVGLDAAFYS